MILKASKKLLVSKVKQMLNPRAIFLFSDFVLYNMYLMRNLIITVPKKFVAPYFSLPLLGFFLTLQILLHNIIKGIKC
jgi:hypothetical protein